MLQKQQDILLVAEAANGKELIEQVKSQEPDIVISDVKMPVMDGAAATRHLAEHYPHIGIIALTMFDEEDLIIDMLEAGARGYLLKNADKERDHRSHQIGLPATTLLLPSYLQQAGPNGGQKQVQPIQTKTETRVQ